MGDTAMISVLPEELSGPIVAKYPNLQLVAVRPADGPGIYGRYIPVNECEEAGKEAAINRLCLAVSRTGELLGKTMNVFLYQLDYDGRIEIEAQEQT